MTTIGAYTFYDNSLPFVIIPDSVTTIGDHAFELNDLTSVTIPGSVTSNRQDLWMKIFRLLPG